MSLRWKSEWQVRLGAQQCEATGYAGFGSGRRALWTHRVEGSGAVAIHALLGHLVAQGHRLPRRADVLLGEDLLHVCVLDADAESAQTAEQARSAAATLLSQALGSPRDDRQVEVSLLDGGRAWLAASVDIAVLDPALDALMHHGIEARRVRVAVLDDLRQVHARLPREVDTLVLVREQGVSLLGFEQGRLVAIEREHLDWRDRETLFNRLAAYAGPPASWPSGTGTGTGTGTGVVAGEHRRTRFLQPESAHQESVLGEAARDTGWVMLPPRRAVVAGEAG